MKEHNLISGDFDVLFDRSCFANETDTISFVSLCLFSFSPMYNTAYLVCKVRTIVTSFPITLRTMQRNLIFLKNSQEKSGLKTTLCQGLGRFEVASVFVSLSAIIFHEQSSSVAIDRSERVIFSSLEFSISHSC